MFSDAKQVFVSVLGRKNVFLPHCLSLTVTALPLASLEPSSIPSTRADLDRIHIEVRNITPTCQCSWVEKIYVGNGRCTVRVTCGMWCAVLWTSEQISEMSSYRPSWTDNDKARKVGHAWRGVAHTRKMSWQVFSFVSSATVGRGIAPYSEPDGPCATKG